MCYGGMEISVRASSEGCALTHCLRQWRFVASDPDHFPRRIPILKKDAKGVFYVLCVLVVLERHLSACQEWLERSEGHPRSGRVAKAERSCTGIAKDGVMKLF